MKKIFTILIATVAISLTASAQICIPDPAFNTPGIHPDTIWPADENVFYSQVITVVVPQDTQMNIFGTMQTVIIDSMVLVEVLGVPQWLDVECAPAGCSFPGGSEGCALFSGLPPTGTGGSYDLGFIVTSYGQVSGFPVSQTDTIENYYTLSVYPLVGIKNTTTWEATVSLYPNPSPGDLYVEFYNATAEEVEMEIYDILGSKIYGWVLKSSAGANKQKINTSSLSEGTYLLTLKKGNSVIIKRFAISK